MLSSSIYNADPLCQGSKMVAFVMSYKAVSECHIVKISKLAHTELF